MAIITNCPIHGDTGHTSTGDCIACLKEKEKRALEEWEAMSTSEKLRDLYRRIRFLEKEPSKF